MKFGVQYYPYHWPESQWADDVQRMKKAGVKYVRMGDLGWSAFEPAAGQLSFDFMDRAIALFGEAGIKTILCTCSRTPPPWLYRAKPSMLPVNPQGIVRHSDGRYAVSLSDPAFQQEALRIDEAMIRHYAGNDHIEAWQIDNEIGCHTDCYSKQSLAAFHRYLAQKYKTVEALNEAWGAHFWSFRVERFEDVPVPVEHPHIQLEYRRFLSGLNKEFALSRAKLMRELDPGKRITTNFQNLYWDHSDYHDMAKAIDVNGMNHYPARTPELALDCFRADRGEVWVLEQQTHLSGIDSPEGWMRLRAWMAIAHGASALIFFRWRQCLYGCEQFGDGIIPHSGREGRLYREFSKIGAELETLAPMIEKTRPYAEVAITYSYESRWAVKAASYGQAVDPVYEAIDLHQALSPIVTSIDALDPRADLSRYKLVVAPRLWLVDDAVAANLCSFVEAGGTLCLTTGAGVVDPYGKCFTEPRPGRLSDLAGVYVDDFVSDEKMKFTLSSSVQALDGLKGGALVDEVHLAGAKVVAEHGSGWRKGQPLVTLNAHGRGQVVYLGARMEKAALQPFMRWLCALAGVAQQFERTEGVTVYERACPDYRLLFLLNWTTEQKEILVGAGWQDVQKNEHLGERVVLQPTDLRVLRKSS